MDKIFVLLDIFCRKHAKIVKWSDKMRIRKPQKDNNVRTDKVFGYGFGGLTGRMGERTREADVAVWARASQQTEETRWTKGAYSKAAEGTRGSGEEPDRAPRQEERIAHSKTPWTWTVNTRFSLLLLALFPDILSCIIWFRTAVSWKRNGLSSIVVKQK